MQDIVVHLQTRFDPQIVQPDEMSREAAKEIIRLREELVEANLMLRSCYSVTERRCQTTNWDAFDKQLAALLERQRVRINEWNGYRTCTT